MVEPSEDLEEQHQDEECTTPTAPQMVSLIDHRRPMLLVRQSAWPLSKFMQRERLRVKHGLCSTGNKFKLGKLKSAFTTWSRDTAESVAEPMAPPMLQVAANRMC